MKKGNLIKSTALVIGFLGLLACDKEEDRKPKTEIVNTEIKKGLPENRRSIHGYLYVGNNGGTTYPQLSVNAFFGDPARDLLGSFDHQSEQSIFTTVNNFPNVSVGYLYFNEKLINTFKNTTSYNYVFSNLTSLPSDVHWKSDGNKSFLPMDLHIPGEFPAINETAVNSHSVISKNQDLVLNFSDFISNCDSVSVTFGYSGGNPSQYARKCVRYSDGKIRFTKEELSNLYYSTIMVTYAGFNYWNKITNNKTFVFEVSNKTHIYTTITN